MLKFKPRLGHVYVLGLLCLSACSAHRLPAGQTPPASWQPESASGYTAKRGVRTTRFAVAAANPLATQAGYDILKAGGSAVDAAIAVQMVLGLVEPQSSGIGGGAFMLHWDANKKCPSAASQERCGLQAFDGRETSPALASSNLFIAKDGKPMPFIEAVVGGRSVGTLGAVRMLELAHQQHGKLAWATLFKPAIDLATNGFAVSPRMNTLLQTEVHLKQDATALAYFYDASGKPWPVGHVLKNPEYAAVLGLIAKGGSQALHAGEVAEAVVRKVQSHPSNPGVLSLQDLATYAPKVREPFCTNYPSNLTSSDLSSTTKIYLICGMPPPSSGAITVAQILGILQSGRMAKNAPQDSLHHPAAFGLSSPHTLIPPDWLHRYLEASRLAFADRAQYIADPDFVAAPAGDWKSLVAPDYLRARAQLVGERAMTSVPAGEPRSPLGLDAETGAKLSGYAPMPDQIEHGTSHISIVDAAGNALAMTTTIEDAFGSRQMVNRGKGLVGGFLLNNQLTDFSFAPADAAGKPIANRVQAGKRPRSSMSPTLVFESDALVASLGSPGGALIIHYTTKTLYGMLSGGLAPQEAINLPNFGSVGGPALLEENRFPATTLEALKERGHEVRQVSMTSGLQGIQKITGEPTGGWVGGADPRREGVVLGD